MNVFRLLFLSAVAFGPIRHTIINYISLIIQLSRTQNEICSVDNSRRATNIPKKKQNSCRPRADGFIHPYMCDHMFVCLV